MPRDFVDSLPFSLVTVSSSHSSSVLSVPDIAPIRRALISVSDKTELVEFAKELVSLGVEIYSTGGTRKFLTDNGLEAVEVANYTGFPEVMDGRVKTLHPKIFGGILARRSHEQDMRSLAEHGILEFDLVVVNLYPFESTIQKENVTPPEAIEQIDIGGPSLIRAAAKNHAFATVATSTSHYAPIIDEMRRLGGTSLKLRRTLAADCFAVTARYDACISNYMAVQTQSETDASSPLAMPGFATPTSALRLAPSM